MATFAYEALNTGGQEVKAELEAPSKEEAVAQSLEWLREEAEKLESIRAAIKKSEEQSARGESRPIDPDELMRRVLKRLEEENAAPPPA